MKSIVPFLIVILTGTKCLSQSFSSLAVFLSEDETGKPISSASIIIKEAGWALKTTGSDGKAFFDKSMPVGEIHYIVSKEGYQGIEGTFNITIEEKSNSLNIKLSKFRDDRLLITGEVVDEDEKDLEGAIVEVKAADIVKSTKTDASGNYKIELTLNRTQYDVNTLKLEVKCSNGSAKKTETLDLTRRNVIYKDFKINCLDVLESVPRFEKDNLLVEAKGCSQSGNNIICKVKITSKGEDAYFGTYFRMNGIQTRVIDEIGNEYFIENIKLANVSNDNQGLTEKELIADFPIEGTLTFSGVNRKVNLLSRLEIVGWHRLYHQGVTIQFNRIQMD